MQKPGPRVLTGTPRFTGRIQHPQQEVHPPRCGKRSALNSPGPSDPAPQAAKSPHFCPAAPSLPGAGSLGPQHSLCTPALPSSSYFLQPRLCLQKDLSGAQEESCRCSSLTGLMASGSLQSRRIALRSHQDPGTARFSRQRHSRPCLVPSPRPWLRPSPVLLFLCPCSCFGSQV